MLKQNHGKGGRSGEKKLGRIFHGNCRNCKNTLDLLRRQVGAVIVKDNRIITTGYNGAPSGLRHCTDIGGCERERLHIPSGQRHELCRALHAEQNAIIQAAKVGVSTGGGDDL